MDMDGVIMRHPVALQVLTNRVNSFVREKVNPYMSLEKAEKINKILYGHFGHTVIGLQKVYDSNITNKDFCKAVYNKSIMDYLDLLHKDELFLEQSRDFEKLAEYCKEHEVPLFLFSNANYQWCRKILEQMNVNNISDEAIISSDSEAYEGTSEVCLKPNRVTYTKAIQHIYRVTQQKEEVPVVYVDDHLENLAPIMNNTYWKPVWMNTNPGIQDLYTENLHTIRDLNQLYNFLWL